ncbi:MAG: DHH family phosphoesterase [Oscillospiraceae bacterium]|nr:DHH family phosphoesterase [Oscillospiraceae bacterium]
MKKKLRRVLQPNMGIYLALFLAFIIATAGFRQYILAGLQMCVWLLLLGAYLLHYTRRKKQVKDFVEKTINQQAGVTGQKPPFPMAVVRMADSDIVFANDRFLKLTGLNDTLKERNICDVLSGFDIQWLFEGKNEYPYDVRYAGQRFRVYGSVIQDSETPEIQLGVLYFADLTELYQIRDEYIRSRPVVSIILVDNYEELTKNLSEGAMSSLNAKINNAITQWTESYHGLLRRLERNRYLFVFEKRDLKRAMDDKFSLLEDVHAITSPSGLAASISFGLGVEGETFEEGYEFASLAIEMALSRGGDQAVVKDRINFNFYGGRNKEAEQRSKVRSRVTANSLMELIGKSSRVLIMGHKNADLDAIGAALGIYCMCRKKGKPAHIVLDLQENMAPDFLKEIRQDSAYTDAFISGQDAMLLSDNRSTLVVVDTNRPDQLECRTLLEAVPQVCVVDHHRRAADYIKPVVVNLHEPYASSASELVTELLQYAVEMEDVLPIEAKALMAGIFLDTKSFNIRTGERTFEAAAFLRQLGADTVEVKKLLQNDFQDTVEKYRIIQSARLYRQEIAIAKLDSGTTRVLASQAADELLNITGISASFVLYPDGERVMVSARSIGETNVQVVLEPLGGGGNTATAGAQITGKTVDEVLDMLVESIDKFFEE